MFNFENPDIQISCTCCEQLIGNEYFNKGLAYHCASFWYTDKKNKRKFISGEYGSTLFDMSYYYLKPEYQYLTKLLPTKQVVCDFCGWHFMVTFKILEPADCDPSEDTDEFVEWFKTVKPKCPAHQDLHRIQTIKQKLGL